MRIFIKKSLEKTYLFEKNHLSLQANHLTFIDMRIKLWAMAAALLCGSMTVSAQESDEQFTIATLNVDGLPQKILMVKLNADGPGDAGTARIGKYLMQKNYDLVMMQEDFSYHNVLTVFLEDDYQFDEWSGEINVSRDIDFLHLQNHRFSCDGLMACWKHDLTVVPQGRTAWTKAFGKFSHANDDLITKGFRRYDVTLRSGEQITVYNMHMDATDDADELIHNDAKDTEARAAQWAQLRDEVLQQLGSKPIIVTGDLNSFYTRDNIKALFIDAINESGKGTASDVWVELKRNGVYPEYVDVSEITDASEISNIRDGEGLDKVIYINPATGTKIFPVAFNIDQEGYQHDGKALGDHYPAVATFQVNPSDKTTGIDDVNRELIINNRYFNLNGQRVNQPQGGIYIVDGQKKVIR